MSDTEWWMIEGTDNTWGGRVGQVVLENVHPPTVCEGQHCVMHNPSDHHMREWEIVWRGDKGVMERTCPHGVGHPDPDDAAFLVREGRDYLTIHGCDGCCRG